ncbi:unnamed protein product, partial [Choristocarpus tenellus]
RSTGRSGRESVALLRTTSMQLYAWRIAGLLISTSKSGGTCNDTAQGVVTLGRAWGETQTESLLEKAVELEPFHQSTLVALAFVILQGGGSIERAHQLLKRAAGYKTRKATPDILQALASIHACAGNRSVATFLLRRATRAS